MSGVLRRRFMPSFWGFPSFSIRPRGIAASRRRGRQQCSRRGPSSAPAGRYRDAEQIPRGPEWHFHLRAVQAVTECAERPGEQPRRGASDAQPGRRETSHVWTLYRHLVERIGASDVDRARRQHPRVRRAAGGARTGAGATRCGRRGGDPMNKPPGDFRRAFIAALYGRSMDDDREFPDRRAASGRRMVPRRRVRIRAPVPPRRCATASLWPRVSGFSSRVRTGARVAVSREYRAARLAVNRSACCRRRSKHLGGRRRRMGAATA